MMSVPSVKPSLPSGVQATKVSSSPPLSASSGPTQSTIGGTKTLTSPVKVSSPTSNHTSNIPLSLVQDHKPANVVNQQQPQPVQPFTAGRSFDKVKDSLPINKPTTNGVDESPSKSPSAATPNSDDFKKDDVPVLNHTPEVPVSLSSVGSTATAATENTASTTVAAAPPVTTTVTSTETTSLSQGQQQTTSTDSSGPSKTEEVAETTPINETNHAPSNPKVEVSSSETKDSTPSTDSSTTPTNTTATVTEPSTKSTDTAKTRTEAPSKPEYKVATPPRNSKRKREVKPPPEPKTPAVSPNDAHKPKRARVPTQPYQSPLYESLYNAKVKPSPKTQEEKLTVFYKNEFLAVRNAEGTFFVCQTTQNIYKNTSKIRIRWLSEERESVYVPDFYDTTDFDCILTNLDLKKLSKNRYQLPNSELERTQNILKRALDVEKGVVEKPAVTEEHPDGLDLSLYRDESQLKKSRHGKRTVKRKRSNVKSDETVSDSDLEDESLSDEEAVEEKKAKLSPRGAEKPKKSTVKEKSKSKSSTPEKKDDPLEAESKEKTRDRAAALKRRSELVAKTSPTPVKSTATTKAALTKQAAVKQTVARQALPQTAKEKKKEKDTSSPVKTSMKKPEQSKAEQPKPDQSTSEQSKSEEPKSEQSKPEQQKSEPLKPETKTEPVQENTPGKSSKTRSGRNVVASALPSPPATPTPAVSSPPKINVATRTKENEPQRLTLTINKGRKKATKRT